MNNELQIVPQPGLLPVRQAGSTVLPLRRAAARSVLSTGGCRLATRIAAVHEPGAVETEAALLSLLRPPSDPPTQPPVESPHDASPVPQVDAPRHAGPTPQVGTASVPHWVRLRSVADPTRVLGGAVLFALVLSVTAAVNLTGQSKAVAERPASVAAAPVTQPQPLPPPSPAPVTPDPPPAVAPALPHLPAAPSARAARPQHAPSDRAKPEFTPEMRDLIEQAQRWQDARQGNR